MCTSIWVRAVHRKRGRSHKKWACIELNIRGSERLSLPILLQRGSSPGSLDYLQVWCSTTDQCPPTLPCSTHTNTVPYNSHVPAPVPFTVCSLAPSGTTHLLACHHHHRSLHCLPPPPQARPLQADDRTLWQRSVQQRNLSGVQLPDKHTPKRRPRGHRWSTPLKSRHPFVCVCVCGGGGAGYRRTCKQTMYFSLLYSGKSKF